MAKSKEEYLIKQEEGLLKKLEENYASINKNLIFVYSVLLILTLLQYKFIDGLKYSSYDLKLSENDRLIFVPGFILIPYAMLNNNIWNISRIIKRLLENSTELKRVNSNAIVFQTVDLEVFPLGIAGLQYHFAKWATKNYIKYENINISFPVPENRDRKTMINFTLRLPNYISVWLRRFLTLLTNGAILLITLVIIYILPLLVVIKYINDSKMHLFYSEFRITSMSFDHLVIALLLIGMALYTFYSNWILYYFYRTELFELVTTIKTTYIKDLINGCKKIYHYYLPIKG